MSRSTPITHCRGKEWLAGYQRVKHALSVVQSRPSHNYTVRSMQRPCRGKPRCGGLDIRLLRIRVHRTPAWMVLMAATPSQPAASAAAAGFVMSVMLGVILAQTGLVAAALIQPHTSESSSQS